MSKEQIQEIKDRFDMYIKTHYPTIPVRGNFWVKKTWEIVEEVLGDA